MRSLDQRRLIMALALTALLLVIVGMWQIWLIPRDVTVCQEFPLMGTFVEVKVVARRPYVREYERAVLKARKKLERFVNRISSWEEDSEISVLNRRAGYGPVKVSPAVFDVLEQALHVAALSEGAFDITFAPLGKLWRLDPEDPYIPSQEEIEAALGLVDYRRLVLDATAGTAFLERSGMRVDLGGIAKGSAVDVMGEALREQEILNAVVNAGGDLLCMGTNPDRNPWRVGIRNPRDKSDILEVLGISDLAVATSGDYEKMVEVDGVRYHHILDPRTGMPVTGAISATVIHPSAEVADALATAIFVLGPGPGIRLIEQIPEAEALIIDPDFQWHSSSRFDSFLEE